MKYVRGMRQVYKKCQRDILEIWHALPIINLTHCLHIRFFLMASFQTNVIYALLMSLCKKNRNLDLCIRDLQSLIFDL